MSAFKEIYDILKDLKDEAKRLKNQEMFSLAIDVQEKVFELKEEIEAIKAENKALTKEIEFLKNPTIKEEDIKYSPNGHFTLNSEKNRLPYCSACWKMYRKLVPLTKSGTGYKYNCPNCKSEISMLDRFGNPLI